MTAPWIAAFVALWALVALIALVVIGVLRRMGGVLEQAERHLASGPHVETSGDFLVSQVPEFKVWSENNITGAGREIPSRELLYQPSILLFMKEGCEPCHQLAQELVGDEGLLRTRLFAVLDEENGRPGWLPGSIPVVFQAEGNLSHLFENSAWPQAYLVNSGHFVLARATGGSLAGLRELAALGNESISPRDGPSNGRLAENLQPADLTRHVQRDSTSHQREEGAI